MLLTRTRYHVPRHRSLGAVLGVAVPTVDEIARPAAQADARIVVRGALYLSTQCFSREQLERFCRCCWGGGDEGCVEGREGEDGEWDVHG